MESIKHHDMMLARNILAPFVNDESADMQDIFMKGQRFIADIIRDVFNKWAIPELVDFNWKNIKQYPELKARRIGDTVDWRTISFAIRNFIGAQAMIPDENLEKWIRDEMDLPKADPETARIAAAPQNPGAAGAARPARVGPPRQSTAAGNQQGNNAGSNGRTGRDASGGG
jgi:hypothetical protein